MHLELIIDADLDPLEDHPIGALDLAIGFEVVHDAQSTRMCEVTQKLRNLRPVN